MNDYQSPFDDDPEALDDLIAEAAKLWTPPPDLPLDQWAEEYFSHPQDGKFRPLGYQREILQVIGDKTTGAVSFYKAARTGMTMCLSIAATYFASADPLRVAMVLKTGEDCTGVTADLFDPAFLNCPETARLLATTATRDTLKHKIFGNGAVFKALAANSPRDLRRHDIDILMLDEVDSYDPTPEGSAVALAARRTQNSFRKKIIMGSTPHREDTSEIYKAWLQSDQRRYFVPCPHCKKEQTIELESLYLVGHDKSTGEELYKRADKVTKGYYDSLTHRSVVMKCACCKEYISESHKADMVENGRWVAQFPEIEDHAGFALSTLYSPFPEATWLKLIKEYAIASKSPDTMMTFKNTVLGEVWSDSTTKLSAEKLMKRAGDFSLENFPEEVLLVTAGVDVQQDRAEIVWMGWSPNGQLYVLGHEKVYGDPTGDLFPKLDGVLRRKFRHPLGHEIGTSAAAIDSSHFTSHVYRYCAGKQSRGIYAIKGVAGKRPLWTDGKTRMGKNGTGGIIYNVGVDTGKENWVHRLTIEDPEAEGYVNFSSEGLPRDDDTLFDQFIAEVRVVALHNGVFKESWKPRIGVRSEGMDCAVYAIAARETLAPNWDLLRDKLTVKHEKQQKPKRKSYDFSDL